jgi:hypothetical protein
VYHRKGYGIGNTNGLFVFREIDAREIRGRELSKKSGISLVWMCSEIRKRDQNLWGPSLFLFSADVRRKA